MPESTEDRDPLRGVLPKGKRSDDPPPKDWRFRLGLIIHKWPIQAALVAALLVLCVPVYVIIEQQAVSRQRGKLIRKQTHSLTMDQARLAREQKLNHDLLTTIVAQRKRSIKILCADNAIIVNVLGRVKVEGPIDEILKANLKKAQKVPCTEIESEVENTG